MVFAPAADTDEHLCECVQLLVRRGVVLPLRRRWSRSMIGYKALF
jgi:hypothetical protein